MNMEPFFPKLSKTYINVLFFQIVLESSFKLFDSLRFSGYYGLTFMNV